MSAVVSDEVGTRLRSVLHELVDPDLDYTRAPTSLGGGAFSANYAFELARVPEEWSGRLVLRLVAGSGLQVRIEAALQDGARAAGLPAPRVLLVEPNPEVLGQPFMVMEFLAGRGFLGGIEWYRFARDFPKMLRSWAATFAEVIALLDSADPTPVLEAMARHGVPDHLALTSRRCPSGCASCTATCGRAMCSCTTPPFAVSSTGPWVRSVTRRSTSALPRSAWP
jgi:hypothetical protein